MTSNTLQAALNATAFLDFHHPVVQAFVAETVGGSTDHRETAVKLYYAVRDEVRYDPYNLSLSEEGLRASTALQNKAGWCVPKAVLLAACCRAAGIPTKLGFADVKNHLTSARLREKMQTDVFAWHGYAAIYLNGRWVKATPAFNQSLCEKVNIYPLEFDGSEDSIYQPFDRSGQKHMEYLQYRGEYDDLPYAEMIASMSEIYNISATSMPDAGDSGIFEFENEVELPNSNPEDKSPG